MLLGGMLDDSYGDSVGGGGDIQVVAIEGGWEGCSHRVGQVKGVCGRQSSPSGFLIAQHFSQVDQISLTRHSQN